MKELIAAKELVSMNLVGATPDEKDDHIFACHEALRNIVAKFTPLSPVAMGLYADDVEYAAAVRASILGG